VRGHAVDNDDGGLLARVGMGPIAAGLAAFATGFICFLWLTTDRAPANAGPRAEARFISAFDAVEAKPLARNAGTVGPEMGSFGARWASLEAERASQFALDEKDGRGQMRSASSSFGERFSLDQAEETTGSIQRTASFEDRFGEAGAETQSAAVPSKAGTQRAVLAAVMPRPRPAVAEAATKRSSKGRYQLASASATSLPLAYASTDTSAVANSALKELTPKASKPLREVVTSRTAIYDITSRTVYLPNGRRLEAHSGLGPKMDNPRYVNVRMHGPTPPNVYDLKLRESLFHGVRAIRLIPTDGSKMYGRDGILAHSYMLGPSGQSNGCVSISDYPAFLDAFLRGEVDRLVVVERLDDPPSPKTASDWFRDLFRRS
jgi:hypothetical protein